MNEKGADIMITIADIHSYSLQSIETILKCNIGVLHTLAGENKQYLSLRFLPTPFQLPTTEHLQPPGDVPAKPLSLKFYDLYSLMGHSIMQKTFLTTCTVTILHLQTSARTHTYFQHVAK